MRICRTHNGNLLDDSRESVFLIQDMFPITEEYVERNLQVIGMMKRGVKFTPTPAARLLVESDPQRQCRRFPQWNCDTPIIFLKSS